MDGKILERIVESSITEAVRARSAAHPVLPVSAAVNIAMLRTQSKAEERSKMSRLVCDHGIRRGLVLEFGAE